MVFELSEQLQSDILYAMENQKETWVIDAQLGAVVPETSACADSCGRYYTLPEWKSEHGYRVMQQFAYSLHNPAVRSILHEILLSGKGVFRSFKDALKPYPEFERLWTRYKRRSMTAAVNTWYNELRSSWGLERIGEEPEDTQELLLDDFIFSCIPAETDAPFYADMLRVHRSELAKLFRPHMCSVILDMEAARQQSASRTAVTLTAESLEHAPAGYISAVLQENTQSARIASLFVFPIFRGMGIGSALLSRCCEMLIKKHVLYVVADCFPCINPMHDFLVHNGFCVESGVCWMQLQQQEKIQFTEK